MSVSSYTTAKGETRYRVRFTTPDGKRTDKRGFMRKRDAMAWQAEHVTTAKTNGTFVDTNMGRATIGELAQDWFEAKQVSCSPSYFETLKIAYHTWVEPQWAHTPVASIQRSQVQAWVNMISAKRSATVTLRAHGILASILDDAKRDKRIYDNPARELELPRKQKKRHTYLTVQQLYQLANASGWRRDIVLTLGLCGMRWGELIALRVDDVDLDRRRLNIYRNAVYISGAWHVGDTKTHEHRTVMFPDVLDEVFQQHCVGKQGGDLVFTAPRMTGFISPSGYEWFTKACEQTGIEHMTVHDLRHTAASLMVQSGANVKAVQRQLGHKSAAMTLDTYADLFDGELDSLSLKLGALVVQELREV